MTKFTMVLAATALFLSACGGGGSGGGTPTGGGTGTGGGGGTGGGTGTTPSNGTTLTRAQLAACPALAGSNDPAAATCLVGTVMGKTLSGEDCKLVIKANSEYEYSTAKLNISHIKNDQDNYYFDKGAGESFIIWDVTLITTTVETLEFKYGFNGEYKIQIDAESNKVKSTCTAQL